MGDGHFSNNCGGLKCSRVGQNGVLIFFIWSHHRRRPEVQKNRVTDKRVSDCTLRFHFQPQKYVRYVMSHPLSDLLLLFSHASSLPPVPLDAEPRSCRPHGLISHQSAPGKPLRGASRVRTTRTSFGAVPDRRFLPLLQRVAAAPGRRRRRPVLARSYFSSVPLVSFPFPFLFQFAGCHQRRNDGSP